MCIPDKIKDYLPALLVSDSKINYNFTDDDLFLICQVLNDCKKESEVEIPIAKRKPILYAILKEYKTDKRYTDKSNNPYEMSTNDMILDKELKLRIQDEERQLFVTKNIEKFLEATKKDELIKNERQLTRLELEEKFIRQPEILRERLQYESKKHEKELDEQKRESDILRNKLDCQTKALHSEIDKLDKVCKEKEEALTKQKEISDKVLHDELTKQHDRLSKEKEEALTKQKEMSDKILHDELMKQKELSDKTLHDELTKQHDRLCKEREEALNKQRSILIKEKENELIKQKEISDKVLHDELTKQKEMPNELLHDELTKQKEISDEELNKQDDKLRKEKENELTKQKVKSGKGKYYIWIALFMMILCAMTIATASYYYKISWNTLVHNTYHFLKVNGYNLLQVIQNNYRSLKDRIHK